MFDLDMFKNGTLAVYCYGITEVMAFLNYLEENGISRDTYQSLLDHIELYPQDAVGIRYVGYKSCYRVGWYSNRWGGRNKIRVEMPFSSLAKELNDMKDSFNEKKFMEMISHV